MKKLLIGLLLGNAVHFGMREAGSLIKAARNKECSHAQLHQISEKCRDATLIEKVLLYELDLGSKMVGQ
jgi:hypothetical protein